MRIDKHGLVKKFSGFPIGCYRNTQTSFLANPMYTSIRHAPKKMCLTDNLKKKKNFFLKPEIWLELVSTKRGKILVGQADQTYLLSPSLYNVI